MHSASGLRLKLLLVLWLAWGSSTAQGDASQPLSLELPTLDGRAFYRLSDEPGRPLLLNFWDTDCPPCVREMPLLDQFAKAHPGIGVIGVNVISRTKARQFLLAHPVNYRQLAGPADPSALLRRFGNPLGALPHSVVLRADHTLCRHKTGEIDATWLHEAWQQCMRGGAHS